MSDKTHYDNKQSGQFLNEDFVGRNSRKSLGRASKDRIMNYKQQKEQHAAAWQAQRDALRVSYDEPQRRSWLPVLRLLGILGLAGWLAWLTWGNVQDYLFVQKVVLPDLTGLHITQAQQALSDLDLNIAPYDVYFNDEPLDHVVDQSPKPNSFVRIGRTITLGINTPPETIKVPNLKGLTLAAAEHALEDSQNKTVLDIAKISKIYSAEEVNTVIEQSLQAGTNEVKGENIDLILSRGPKPPQVTMPDVTYMSINAAKEKLAANNIRNVKVAAGGVGYGVGYNVIRQRPEAGTAILASVSVDLYYNIPSSYVTSVPDLRGLSLAEARQKVRNAGLQVGWIDYVDVPGQAAGVYEWQPRGYTVKNSPVVLRFNGTAAEANPIAKPTTETVGANTTPAIDPNTLPDWLKPNNNNSNGGIQPLETVGSTLTQPNPSQPISQPSGTVTTTITPNQSSSSTGVVDVSSPFTPRTPTLPPVTNLSQPNQPTPQPITTQSTPQLTPSQPLEPQNPPARTIVTSQPSSPAPADVSNARNITIRFNPQNYGFLQAQDNVFELVVVDEQGERKMINQTLTGSDVINQVVTVYGAAELRTYINGNLFQAWNP